MAACAGLTVAASACLLTTPLTGLAGGPEAAGAGDGGTFLTPTDGGENDGPVVPDSDGSIDRSSAGDAGGPMVVSFTLIDTSRVAQNGAPIVGFDPIVEGAVIDRALTGSSLSLRVNTSPMTVGSVSMARNGGSPIIEGAAPYALCGDDAAGHWSACSWTVGANNVVATAYDAADASGGSGPRLTLHFTLK